MYHSTATLRGDGTVASGGGDFYSPDCPAQLPSPCNCNLANDTLAAAPGVSEWQYSFESDFEIFTPAYLFHGPAPVINNAPPVVSYGTDFAMDVAVPTGSSLGKITLLRPSSGTHGDDFEQRYLELPFEVDSVADAGTGWETWRLTVTPPANGNAAQPGYWMLFAVLANPTPSVAKPFLGIPSVARFVRL
ncbi:MAG: galactose oxidase early set domain-containing protein [Planctomycetes bacterium]|nr:galactose oxidase early set domain-containing protein [Planctomycetota bacterium]